LLSMGSGWQPGAWTPASGYGTPRLGKLPRISAYLEPN
jgi:hypothetical protein